MGDAKRLLTSRSVEWYTPPFLVEPAREVVGGFDIDPASCAVANKTVQASVYYTAESDGLKHAWVGRVWCNPPYGKCTPLFVAKALAEYQIGNASDIFLLLKAATDTKWFRPLLHYPICFVHRRVKFATPTGTYSTATFPSVVVYLGPRISEFAHAYRHIGSVLMLFCE